MSNSIPQFVNSLTIEILASNASSLLTNQTLAALVCSASNLVACTAICANTDLAGIGVRIAFYLQSAMNSEYPIRVISSPSDSPNSTTGHRVSPRLCYKRMGGYAAYRWPHYRGDRSEGSEDAQSSSCPPCHEVSLSERSLAIRASCILMLNTRSFSFATLSCISSLAVAPMLPVWRSGLKSRSNAKGLQIHTFKSFNLDEDLEDTLRSEVDDDEQKKIEAAQNRERVILALALLTQVVLQWAWGIILFVSPIYDQPECSGDTVLMLFFAPFTVKKIKGSRFAVWPMWLLFCLGVTFGLTIILSLSRPICAQPAHLPLTIHSPSKNRRKSVVVLGNVGAFSLWTLYIFGE